jgi:hypothetical protein
MSGERREGGGIYKKMEIKISVDEEQLIRKNLSQRKK